MKRLMKSRIYFNGEDISNLVYEINVCGKPDYLTMATITVPVRAIQTVVEGDERYPLTIYRLGDDG